MRILLIAGGWSSEREVSLSGARVIEESLRRLGHAPTFFDLSAGFDRLIVEAKKHDFSFISFSNTQYNHPDHHDAKVSHSYRQTDQ